MLADLRVSPWQPTRERQDFSETLYLNLSLVVAPNSTISGGLFKIQLNTTAGYFELPNYMNGQQPGPLLDDDPSNHCDQTCPSQFTDVTRDYTIHQRRQESISPIDYVPTFASDHSSVWNKGPLFTIAIALFGQNSYLDSRSRHPAAYISPTGDNDTSADSADRQRCIDQAPLQGLLRQTRDVGETQLGYCITTSVTTTNDHQEELASFVNSLLYHPEMTPTIVKSAFEAAAFIANQAWLLNGEPGQAVGGNYLSGTQDVSRDLGLDSEVPVLSEAGIIVISVLMFVYLSALFAMALYSMRRPEWAHKLDAVALLRIGRSMEHDFPLDDIHETEKSIDVITLPGELPAGFDRGVRKRLIA